MNWNHAGNQKTVHIARGDQQASSIINEVIKAVLNSLFLKKKDFAHTTSTKTQKQLKSQKTKKFTKTFGKKHKNANRRINDYFPLGYF